MRCGEKRKEPPANALRGREDAHGARWGRIWDVGEGLAMARTRGLVVSSTT